MPLRHLLAAAMLLALVAPVPAHAGWTTPEYVGNGWAAWGNGRNGGIGVVAVAEDKFAIKVNSGIHTAFAERLDGTWGSEFVLRHIYGTYTPPDSWLRTNGQGAAAFVDSWALSQGPPLDFPVLGSVVTLVRSGGGPWGAPENVRADQTGNVKGKAPPVVDADGNVTVFWAREESGGTATIWARTKPAGQAWGTPQLVLSGATGYSPLGDTAIDDEGRMYVLTSLGLTVRNPATGAWSAPEVAPSDAFDLATYAGGHLVVLNYAPRYSDFKVHERDRDGVWSSHTIGPAPNNGIHDSDADLAVAPNGAAALVWRQIRTESNVGPALSSIQVAVRPAGGSWQPPEQVTPEVTGAEDWNSPTVAIGPSGEVRAVWGRYANYTVRLQTRVRSASGDWGPIEHPGRNEPAYVPEIAIDPAGTALIVWHGGPGVHAGAPSEILASASNGTASDYLPLTVDKHGTGTGTVTSEPAGIVCGTDCTESYPWGTSVTLTASPDPGSNFIGWGGACALTQAPTCVVPIEKATSATAVLTWVGQPPQPIPPPPPIAPPPPPPPAVPRPAAPQPKPAKKKVAKKATLCFRKRTIKVPKKQVAKYKKKGAKLGACKKRPKKKL